MGKSVSGHIFDGNLPFSCKKFKKKIWPVQLLENAPDTFFNVFYRMKNTISRRHSMLSGRTEDNRDTGDNTSTLSRSGWTVVRVGSGSTNTLTPGDEEVRVESGMHGEG